MDDEHALFALIRAGNLRDASHYIQQFPSACALTQQGITTPLMLCLETLLQAVQSWHQHGLQGGDEEIENRMRLFAEVAKVSSDYYDRNSHGQTVLHLAAAAGCKGNETVSSVLALFSGAILEWLLPEESSIEDNNMEGDMISKTLWQRCQSKQTALHTAIIHRNYKAATLLLKHMAKNKARDYRDYWAMKGEMVPRTLFSLALEHKAPRKFLKLILRNFPQAVPIIDVCGDFSREVDEGMVDFFGENHRNIRNQPCPEEVIFPRNERECATEKQYRACFTRSSITRMLV